MQNWNAIPRDYQILLVLCFVLPFLPLVSNSFQLSLLILILYWGYLGTAWNIMGGYAGQFSFGHAAFFGIGAYTSTVLLTKYGISTWVGLFVGGGLGAAFGAFMGFLTFRFGVKGHFFALATFAFAEMLRLIASSWDYLEATIGIHIPLIGEDDWSLLQFEKTPANFYYVILVMLLLSLLLTIVLSRSKWGYYFQAVREDEDAAAALGVHVLRYKILAVSISAGLTAMGGTFFVQRFQFVDPSLAFGVAISIDILLRPIFGGAGTVWGPLVGAVILTPLEEVTRSFVRNPPPFLSMIEGRSGIDVMLFGVILIVVVIYMPDGIVGTLPRWVARIRGDGNQQTIQEGQGQ